MNILEAAVRSKSIIQISHRVIRFSFLFVLTGIHREGQGCAGISFMECINTNGNTGEKKCLRKVCKSNARNMVLI